MSEVDVAVARLVASFADDPVVQWLDLPSPTELFRPVAEAAWARGTLDLALPGAVAVWMPGGAEAEPESAPEELPERLRAYAAATAAALPRCEPYLHLQFIGVAPGARGRGLGGRLLERGLARARNSSTPTHLEASTRRSAALYERHGFTRVGQEIVLPDGPALAPMRWHPDSGASA